MTLAVVAQGVVASLAMYSNKTTFDFSAMVSCVCELIIVYETERLLLFDPVRVVHKTNCRLKNYTRNYVDLCNVTEILVVTGPVRLLCQFHLLIKETRAVFPHRCKTQSPVDLHVLSVGL